MINLISAILFGLSANLDNIAIGISYGLKKIHISFFKVFMISIFTTLFTFISMFLGKYLVNLLNENIANSIGAYILIILGTYTILKECIIKLRYRHKRIKNEKPIKPIDFKELMTLILILSTNNIAAGIAASAAGINILLTTIFSFIFSFLLLLISNRIGKNILNSFVEKYCNIISSIILTLLGIIEL